MGSRSRLGDDPCKETDGLAALVAASHEANLGGPGRNLESWQRSPVVTWILPKDSAPHEATAGEHAERDDVAKAAPTGSPIALARRIVPVECRGHGGVAVARILHVAAWCEERVDDDGQR